MPDELQTAIDVLSHPGFQIGFITGLVGAGLLLVLALALRRPVPGWGLVFAVAVGVGLVNERGFEPDSFVPLAVLAAAGLLVDATTLLSRSRLASVVMGVAWLAPAAAAVWFIMEIEFTGPSWATMALPLTVLVMGAGAWWLGRLPLSDLVGPLLAISVAGAWVTIPETDDFTVILGAALPLAVATLPPIRARASAIGALGLAGLFAWLVLGGGEVRPWTMLASWATIAPLPLIAAVVSFTPRRPSSWAVFLIHVIYVAAITRVADYTESAFVVAAGFVVLISLVAVALWFGPQPSLDDQPAS